MAPLVEAKAVAVMAAMRAEAWVAAAKAEAGEEEVAKVRAAMAVSLETSAAVSLEVAMAVPPEGAVVVSHEAAAAARMKVKMGVRVSLERSVQGLVGAIVALTERRVAVLLEAPVAAAQGPPPLQVGVATA